VRQAAIGDVARSAEFAFETLPFTERCVRGLTNRTRFPSTSWGRLRTCLRARGPIASYGDDSGRRKPGQRERPASAINSSQT